VGGVVSDLWPSILGGLLIVGIAVVAFAISIGASLVIAAWMRRGAGPRPPGE
jgi:hypothetical protein